MTVSEIRDPRFRTAAESPDEILARLGPDELRERLRALQSVTEAILAHFSLHELLDALLGRLRALLYVDEATVLLCTEDRTQLAVRASHGLHEEVEARVHIPIGQGLAGTVAARRTPVIVDDVRAIATVSPALQQLRSMMVAPLLAEGDLIGVLHVGSRETRVFTDADLHLLQVVADRVALAIRHALAHDRLRASLAERDAALETLRAGEQRYRSLVEATAAIVWTTPASGEAEDEMPGWQEFTGQTPREFRAGGWLEAVHPDDREATRLRWQRALDERSLYSMEHRVRRRDGEYRHMLVRAVPIHDEHGEVAEWVGIYFDTTDQVAAREELERLYAEVKQASQAKSDFLATVSHELRTPLNAIIGYSQLLREGIPAAVPEPARRQVGKILGSAQHLLDLIEEILTFSRLEAGREHVRPARTRLGTILEQVGAVVEPLVEAKSLTLRLDAPDHVVELHTDERKVRQILLNLLDNAVKFTERGEVALAARAEGDTLVLEVSDTGAGIAAEHRARIFEPFWQVEQSMTRQAPGTGLGLTVAARLTSLLHGEIGVESEPGRGSRFTVRLPREVPAD